MKPPQYTTREVLTLLFQGSDAIDEMLKNKARLKDAHLGLIMALAVECLGDEMSPKACTESGSANPQAIKQPTKEQP